LLAADSLAPIASGIGRVARLMARVIVEEADAGRLDASALTLHHAGDGDIAGARLRVRSARGSRARFLLATHAAALSSTHFAYDFTGLARAHCRLPGLCRPYLTWLHGIEAWERARPDRLRRARDASLLLVNSQYTLDRAARLHGAFDRARVCWLATESDAPGEGPAAEGPPKVLIVGRLDAGGGYKGHRELLDAWPAVVDAVPGARLVIVGDGPGAPVVREWVRCSPARAAIDLLGFVPEHAMGAVWRAASVFAMPSRGEGFGVVYAEAMRHGIPVVASAHDAAVEVVVDEETGYQVGLGTPGRLTDCLVALLRDESLRRALGEGGRRRWQAHFRYGAFRARFGPLLSAFLRGRG
jgi:phosphatidylinositol alpha-1,6-mannosyltransferase